MENSTISFKAKHKWPFVFGQYLETEVQLIDGAKSLSLFLTNEKETRDHFNEKNFTFTDNISHGVHVLFPDFQEKKFIVDNGRGSRLHSEHTVHSENTIKFNILISEEKFFIAVDGIERIQIDLGINIKRLKGDPTKEANQLKGFLTIDGDVRQTLSLNCRQAYPKVWPPSIILRHGHTFTNEIPQPFRPGHLILLRGLFFGAPSGRFTVQLNHLDSEATVFLFNARFDEQVVVRNTSLRSNSDYGTEERDGVFPFNMKRPLCMGIAFKEKELIVAIDGKEFCSFVYRYQSEYPLNSFGCLRVIDEMGTYVRITEISHDILDSDCKDFEKFTRQILMVGKKE